MNFEYYAYGEYRNKIQIWWWIKRGRSFKLISADIAIAYKYNSAIQLIIQLIVKFHVTALNYNAMCIGTVNM